jgi:hypothetical protein
MSFFRHREIFRSDVIRSVRRCESFEQIARQHSNWKTFALRTRYKRSAGPPDTLTVLPENAAMGRHIIFSRLLGERPIRRSLAHRLDEFPVGYSSASYTPAALAYCPETGMCGTSAVFADQRHLERRLVCKRVREGSRRSAVERQVLGPSRVTHLAIRSRQTIVELVMRPRGSNSSTCRPAAAAFVQDRHFPHQRSREE